MPDVKSAIIGTVLVMLAVVAKAHADDAVCKDSRPDCPQAVAFFTEFQEALKNGDRNSLSSMVRYPLRVRLNGKPAFIRSKREFLQGFDRIFEPVVRCAVLAGRAQDVWGNWRGFTISSGAIWWERRNAPDAPFEVITVNNEGYYKGCGDSTNAFHK